MGFYLRKSISVGPLRFNLSKSGIGVSAGIPGVRVGTGPRGNYIHVGKGGLYYRKTLSQSGSKEGRPHENHVSSETASPASTHGPMRTIASGSVSQMVDSSSAALLSEIERKRKRMLLWPWMAGASVALVGITVLSEASKWLIWPLGVLLFAGVVSAFYWDLLKKSVVMMYDLEDESREAFQLVYEAVSGLARCGATWHVNARGDVYDPKYHAGASNLVNRQSIRVGEQEPPYVRTNLSIVRIPAGSRVLYFLPDQVLVYSSQGVGAISYDDICVEFESTRFIEDGRVPRDAKVVDHTWKYVNKSGGPDRRFKDNHQIPICEYEQILLISESGLQEQLQASRIGIGGKLHAAFRAMSKTLDSCRRNAATLAEAATPHEANAATPQFTDEYEQNSNQTVSSQTKLAPGASSHIPSMEEVYEALLEIMSCVMVADGRASSSEKARIKELMKKVRVSWTPDEIDQRIAAFIGRVQSKGFKEVLDASLEKVRWFSAIGRTDILLQCVDRVMNADGKVSSDEQALCNKIRELTTRSSDN